jgi:cytochrome c556
MNFRTFDILFALVLAVGVAAAVVGFYVVDPYPTVVAAAFAAGASAFLYFALRIKTGGAATALNRRLDAEGAARAREREEMKETLTGLEALTQRTRDQLHAEGERTRAEVEILRKNVTGVLTQFQTQLERATAAENELRGLHERQTAATDARITAIEAAAAALRAGADALAADFNAYVADEHHFREVIQNRLAERVTYLEDFIREKRKSLQI